mgnify:CR=1 FL=1
MLHQGRMLTTRHPLQDRTWIQTIWYQLQVRAVINRIPKMLHLIRAWLHAGIPVMFLQISGTILMAIYALLLSIIVSVTMRPVVPVHIKRCDNSFSQFHATHSARSCFMASCATSAIVNRLIINFCLTVIFLISISISFYDIAKLQSADFLNISKMLNYY